MFGWQRCSKCKPKNFCSITVSISGGLTSLEDYFQKGALFGQKAAPNLWYVEILKTVPEHLMVCRIWPIKFFNKNMLSYIFYSHNSIVSFQ